MGKALKHLKVQKLPCPGGAVYHVVRSDGKRLHNWQGIYFSTRRNYAVHVARLYEKGDLAGTPYFA